MKKWHVGVALTAVIILAALALLALLRGDGESEPIAPVAPTADTFSPSTSKVDAPQTQTAQHSDSESESPDEGQEIAIPVVAKTYHFLTWQDAMEEFARWMGNEYERLKAEGHPDPGFQAYRNFMGRDDDPEIAALTEAMGKFIPIPPGLPGMSKEERDSWNATAIPWKIWSNHIWVLVWAGKLPEGSQYDKVTLPNGEVYHLEKYQQLQVTYQTRTPPRSKTAEGAQILEGLRQRESDLYSSLINASDAELDSIAEELQKVKSEITALQSPTISPISTLKAGVADHYAGHPDFEVIELDLGIIDVAPADDD